MPDLFPDDRKRLSLDPGAVLLGGFALPIDFWGSDASERARKDALNLSGKGVLAVLSVLREPLSHDAGRALSAAA